MLKLSIIQNYLFIAIVILLSGCSTSNQNKYSNSQLNYSRLESELTQIREKLDWLVTNDKYALSEKERKSIYELMENIIIKDGSYILGEGVEIGTVNLSSANDPVEKILSELIPITVASLEARFYLKNKDNKELLKNLIEKNYLLFLKIYPLRIRNYLDNKKLDIFTEMDFQFLGLTGTYYKLFPSRAIDIVLDKYEKSKYEGEKVILEVCLRLMDVQPFCDNKVESKAGLGFEVYKEVFNGINYSVE